MRRKKSAQEKSFTKRPKTTTIHHTSAFWQPFLLPKRPFCLLATVLRGLQRPVEIFVPAVRQADVQIFCVGTRRPGREMLFHLPPEALAAHREPLAVVLRPGAVYAVEYGRLQRLAGAGVGAVVQKHRQPVLLRAVFLRRRAHSLCLLYTSDAADE